MVNQGQKFRLRLNKNLQLQAVLLLAGHSQVGQQNVGLNLHLDELVDGGIDARSKFRCEGLALFLWSFGLISDGLDVLLEGSGVVLIDEVEFIILFQYALDLDERPAGSLLQDLVFLAVQRDLLFSEALFED